MRLSLQGVGVAELKQVVNSIHWATKMLAALLGDGTIVIALGATKAATKRMRVRLDTRTKEISLKS